MNLVLHELSPGTGTWHFSNWKEKKKKKKGCVTEPAYQVTGFWEKRNAGLFGSEKKISAMSPKSD